MTLELESTPAEPFLSIGAIQAALERCMHAHPPEGLERSLHSDADAIASKWALMRYLDESELALRGLDEHFLMVFSRWNSSPGQQPPPLSESTKDLS